MMGGGSYRMRRAGDGYELHFASERATVHRFGPKGDLVQVRVTCQGIEFCKTKTADGWGDVTRFKGE
jgi:hypothetical protein